MREKFRCIVADCPWSYGGTPQFQPEGEDKFRAVRQRYPTMKLADILALPVADLAADECVMLFWATAPLLPEALQVVNAWGFEYVSKIPWIKLTDEPRRTLTGEVEFKPQYGTGFWGRGCSEDVLICRRGRPKPPKQVAGSLLLLSENFGHSKKVNNLYEYAEYFPGPYLELFARTPRDGWTSMGNGISGKDIRDEIGEYLAAMNGGE